MQIAPEQIKPTDQDFAQLLFSKDMQFIQLQKYSKILEDKIKELETKVSTLNVALEGKTEKTKET